MTTRLQDLRFQFVRSQWLSKGTFNIPTASNESLVKLLPGSFYRKLFRPSTKSLSFPLVGERSVVSAIVGLYPAISPSTIIRGVPLVDVNPVKSGRGVRCLVGLVTFSHIIIKVLKLVPPLADRNTSASVKFVVPFIRIIASLPHVYPGSINRVVSPLFIPQSKYVCGCPHNRGSIT